MLKVWPNKYTQRIGQVPLIAKQITPFVWFRQPCFPDFDIIVQKRAVLNIYRSRKPFQFRTSEGQLRKHKKEMNCEKGWQGRSSHCLRNLYWGGNISKFTSALCLHLLYSLIHFFCQSFMLFSVKKSVLFFCAHFFLNIDIFMLCFWGKKLFEMVL